MFQDNALRKLTTESGLYKREGLVRDTLISGGLVDAHTQSVVRKHVASLHMKGCDLPGLTYDKLDRETLRQPPPSGSSMELEASLQQALHDPATSTEVSDRNLKVPPPSGLALDGEEDEELDFNEEDLDNLDPNPDE